MVDTEHHATLTQAHLQALTMDSVPCSCWKISTSFEPSPERSKTGETVQVQTLVGEACLGNKVDFLVLSSAVVSPLR